MQDPGCLVAANVINDAETAESKRLVFFMMIEAPCGNCRSLRHCRLADGWLFGSLYLMTELIRQRAIEGERRADCVLVAIVVLAALAIDVEVVLRRLLLVALHSSIRSGPGEGISNL